MDRTGFTQKSGLTQMGFGGKNTKQIFKKEERKLKKIAPSTKIITKEVTDAIMASQEAV